MVARNGVAGPLADRDLEQRYRPHLDGVRGVAIALVLMAHFAGWPRGSGHIGVALFFALSGYLITGLLLDEHTGTGAVDLVAFYGRRIGRLAPGLVVMVALTGPVLIADRSTVNVTRSTIAALTYTTNYAEISGWLPASTAAFGQTWSLAIEEHFYLLWAPVLLLAARRGGARSALKAALIGSAIAITTRIAVALATNSYWWIARGSFDRADALLVGCAAAAAVRLGWRPPRWLLPLSVLTICALSKLLPGESQGHHWALAIGLAVLSLSTAGFVVTLDHHAGWTRRALSLRPVVWVGAISYSLYLWHVAVIEMWWGDATPNAVKLAYEPGVGLDWLTG
jgi:peptidoglycan/LPS O-acetylase OafA/YrhL